MPLSPRAAQAAADRRARSAVSPPEPSAGQGLQRGGQKAAIAAITAPNLKGDGYRLLVVGLTGAGKTHAARKLIGQPGSITLIHDDAKAQPEYPELATYFTSTQEMLAKTADELQTSTVAFRGDPYRGIVCEVEEVAATALWMARARIKARLVVDETDRAVSDGGRKLEAPSLRAGFIQGRTMGLDIICNVQIPQRMPDISAMASSVALFRLEAAPLGYVLERFSMAPELADIVPHLPDGDFVLHRTGYAWDRTVYRFDP